MAARHQVVVRGVSVGSIVEQFGQTDFIVRLSFPGQRVLFKTQIKKLDFYFNRLVLF